MALPNQGAKRLDLGEMRRVAEHVKSRGSSGSPLDTSPASVRMTPDDLLALVEVVEAASDFELLYTLHDHTPPHREAFDRLMAALERFEPVAKVPS